MQSARSNAFSIRPFREEDAQEVSALISRCLNETLSLEFTEAQLRFFYDRFSPDGLRRLATECTMFVAVEGKRILGTASLAGDRVKGVFVNPSCYRQGIGALLLNHLEDEARRRNITECVLHANHHASGFYERLGYRLVKEVY